MTYKVLRDGKASRVGKGDSCFHLLSLFKKSPVGISLTLKGIKTRTCLGQSNYVIGKLPRPSWRENWACDLPIPDWHSVHISHLYSSAWFKGKPSCATALWMKRGPIPTLWPPTSQKLRSSEHLQVIPSMVQIKCKCTKTSGLSYCRLAVVLTSQKSSVCNHTSFFSFLQWQSYRERFQQQIMTFLTWSWSHSLRKMHKVYLKFPIHGGRYMGF